MGMTLLLVILTKNVLLRSYSTFAYLLRAYIRNINMHMYITSAHGHELSGSVHADAYNLIYYALYYYAPWPWPVLCMVHERHVILNVFHTRLAV